MSTDNENNIKVSINEEYDRVLSNPDGLIMSDGLAERLEGDWNLGAALKRLEGDHSQAFPNLADEDVSQDNSEAESGFTTVTTPEKNSIRVFSKENENIGLVYGEVQSFSSIDDDYSIGILIRGDHRGFMGTLMAVQKGDAAKEEFGFDVAGRNGFIALSIEISSWSFSKINSYDTSLTINFGSQHVQF